MALTKQDLNQISMIMADALEQIVIPRFDEMDVRFDRLEARVARLEERMDKLETRMSAQESISQELLVRTGNLEKTAVDISSHLKAVENDVIELYAVTKQHTILLNKTYQALTDRAKLPILHDELHSLAKKLNIKLAKS